ncbi:uncharacterized protein J4E92_006074 [Alternaria infectoria]|uniref:uncharacterized protein n=1 Tax=Alternaria infectoria TaxID=45303 RepID=UPI00221E39E7|nr:uncharacterized protein J4E92_006074 [Alternaria infectoria]KAI4926913.1 hypothetical protein J4E92_006074 [Alternaria infectoria]
MVGEHTWIRGGVVLRNCPCVHKEAVVHQRINGTEQGPVNGIVESTDISKRGVLGGVDDRAVRTQKAVRSFGGCGNMVFVDARGDFVDDWVAKLLQVCTVQ